MQTGHLWDVQYVTGLVSAAVTLLNICKMIKESVLQVEGQDSSPMTASICSAKVSLSNKLSA